MAPRGGDGDDGPVLAFPSAQEATGSTGRSGNQGEAFMAWWGADLTVKGWPPPDPGRINSLIPKSFAI